MKIATRCVHLPPGNDPYGATAPPIYQTATFRQPGAAEFGEYDYSRTANPTRALAEAHLAALEGGRFACAFASGMAALVAVTRLVRGGEEILAGDDLYGGTVRLLSRVAPGLGVRVRHVDTTDRQAVAAALSPATRLLLVETPTNPLLRIAVFFPALAPPAAREIHERQASGPGSVVSFTTGDPERSRRIVEAARLFAIAVSFGSVGSSISLPCRMSHASIPQELRGRLGPPPDLIRLSVGIEDADDLIADLGQALDL